MMASPGDSGALERRGQNYIRTRSTGQEQGITEAGRGLARGIQSAVAGGIETYQRQREFQEKMKDRSYDRALTDARLQEMTLKLDMMRNLQDIKMREAQASLLATQARAAQEEFKKKYLAEDRELSRAQKFANLPPWQEGSGPNAKYFRADLQGNKLEIERQQYEWEKTRGQSARGGGGGLADLLRQAVGGGGQAGPAQANGGMGGPAMGRPAMGATPAAPAIPAIDDKVVDERLGTIRSEVSSLVPTILKGMPKVEKDVQARLKNQGTMDDYKNKIARNVAKVQLLREMMGLPEMPLEDLIQLAITAEEKTKSNVNEGFPPVREASADPGQGPEAEIGTSGWYPPQKPDDRTQRLLDLSRER